MTRWVGLSSLMLIATMLMGCSSAYYGTWEKLGVHKREILVDRVEEARDDQQQAAEQFASALDQFRSVVNFDAGELDTLYNRLNRELERSQSRAEDVRDRIESVENVADALFEEWEEELDQYSDPQLRSASESQLDRTRNRYRQMITAMRRASNSMDPVLTVFEDQVLFLKHNLNARAIDALQETSLKLEDDVKQLIDEMNRSIREADDFISTMRAE